MSVETAYEPLLHVMNPAPSSDATETNPAPVSTMRALRTLIPAWLSSGSGELPCAVQVDEPIDWTAEANKYLPDNHGKMYDKWTQVRIMGNGPSIILTPEKFVEAVKNGTIDSAKAYPSTKDLY